MDEWMGKMHKFETLGDNVLEQINGGGLSDICVNLKAYRKQTGLTQAEVANQLHLDTTTISGYERGKIIPSLEVMIELSEYYKVSIDTLVGR